jgi:hypothetical protein
LLPSAGHHAVRGLHPSLTEAGDVDDASDEQVREDEEGEGIVLELTEITNMKSLLTEYSIFSVKTILILLVIDEELL